MINYFRVTLKIPDVKHNEMFKNYVATDTIFDTFEDIHFDVGANTSLKVNILYNYRLTLSREHSNLHSTSYIASLSITSSWPISTYNNKSLV